MIYEDIGRSCWAFCTILAPKLARKLENDHLIVFPADKKDGNLAEFEAEGIGKRHTVQEPIVPEL